MPIPPAIAVFGSSQPHPGTPAYDDAYRVGLALGRRGWTVVSGGYHGVMEAASKGAKDAGGATVGVTTAFFAAQGLAANAYIDTEITVPTYAERLNRLTGTADGYVIMRGGSGTLNEWFHVWELVKNGSITRRSIVLYGGLWPRIMECLTAELGGEAAFSRYHDLLSYASDPAVLAEMLASALVAKSS